MRTIHSKTTAPLKSLLSRLAGIRVGNAVRHEPRPAPGETRDDEYAGERADCGGYNEAFVMQYWAGYNPRH